MKRTTYRVGNTDHDSALAAYRHAYQLLLAGAPVVCIETTNHAPTCWDLDGRHVGQRGLLQRFAPAEHPIEPRGSGWCSCTFPAWAWTALRQTEVQVAEPVQCALPLMAS